ncbi:MAG TPA: hypothetical protein ENJ82_09555 [Bacteroidetes bacterium]|nr:hypothetical protein [Bacteroidota bacterium]
MQLGNGLRAPKCSHSEGAGFGAGKVAWIGLRSERRAPMQVIAQAEAVANHGFIGDRKAKKPGSHRQITLIMQCVNRVGGPSFCKME